MKTILCKCGKNILVDDDYYELFLSLIPWECSTSKGTAVRSKGGRLPASRVILGHPLPGFLWDHKDRDIHNNQKENLRLATYQQSAANRSVQKNNKSGYKGVSWNSSRKKWYAFIVVDDRSIYLGSFCNPKNAAFAYNEAAVKYFGEFAVLNQV